MTQHPRVLVEAARLQATVMEERRAVERRGFGEDAGFRVSARDMERVARELVEDEDQLAELEALTR